MIINGKQIFIDFACSNLDQFLVAKRNNGTFTTKDDFLYESDYRTWTRRIEDLRVISAKCAVAIHNNEDNVLIKSLIDEFFISHKRMLGYFKNESYGCKIRASYSDLQVLLTMVGKGVSTRQYHRLDDYLEYGRHSFRRDYENFLADKIIYQLSKTPEELEEERKARVDRKKLQRKQKMKIY